MQEIVIELSPSVAFRWCINASVSRKTTVCQVFGANRVYDSSGSMFALNDERKGSIQKERSH